MLIVVLLGLIWLLLYTGLYGCFGSWLARHTSGLSPRFPGSAGSVIVAAVAMAGALAVLPLLSRVESSPIRSSMAGSEPQAPIHGTADAHEFDRPSELGSDLKGYAVSFCIGVASSVVAHGLTSRKLG